MATHAIVYAGGIQVPQTNLLRNQLAFLNQPAQPQAGLSHLPCKKLLLIISSWGGNLFEARNLYGLIRSLPYPVEIHAVGSIKSCTVPLMLASDHRTASPGTTFMFHPWTWGTDVHPGHTAAALDQFPLSLEDDVNWGKNTLMGRSKITQADIDTLQLFEKTRYEDTAFALKYGLISKVEERKIPPGIMTWHMA